MSINLGVKVQDKITGFAGTVTGVVNYLTGCNQALVVPPVGSDGNMRDGQWFDFQRLDVTDSNPIILDNEENPGCDMAPTRRV